MSLAIFTARVGYRDRDTFNITAQSGALHDVKRAVCAVGNGPDDPMRTPDYWDGLD
jgi:hypothetical protein